MKNEFDNTYDSNPKTAFIRDNKEMEDTRILFSPDESETLRCPVCFKMNPAYASVCIRCGSDLTHQNSDHSQHHKTKIEENRNQCPVCGREYEEGANFCMFCGQSLQPVLSADLPTEPIKPRDINKNRTEPVRQYPDPRRSNTAIAFIYGTPDMMKRNSAYQSDDPEPGIATVYAAPDIMMRSQPVKQKRSLWKRKKTGYDPQIRRDTEELDD